MTTETTAAATTTNATTAAAGTTAATTAAATTTTQAQGFDWKGALGDKHGTYQPLIEGKGWKSPAEALDGYTNLEKMIGGDKIVLPGKDAKDEDWNAVYAKLGRPEKPEGYELKKPENFEAYSDDLATGFRAEAHKHGLSAKQAAALHDWWVGQTKGMLDQGGEAQKAQIEKAEADLAVQIKTAWGAEKDEKMAAAKRAARHFGFDDATLLALESKAGSFKMLDGLARMGAGLQEDNLSGKGGPIIGADAARAELQRLESDKDFRAAYLDRGHPGHAEAVQRMTRLSQQAAPNSVGHGYR